MLKPYFCHATLDDLMHEVFESVLAHGRPVKASRGGSVELTGVMLELTDIRARLSRTEAKGTPFSALGEFCWYLSGRGDYTFISYYLPRAYDLEKDVEPDGATISGAYGPRLISSGGKGQLEQVIGMLARKPSTRQAVLQLFDASDLRPEQRDVPCTCTIQLLIREGRLEVVTYMRSNDAFRGLPHDVFCFTMLQEWIARRLEVDVGTYKHAVGSLHIYEENAADAQRFLHEGFQSTQSPMPPMPKDDPQGALRALLDAEAALRENPPDFERATEIEAKLDGYWSDLVRLLRVYRYSKDKDEQAIMRVQKAMASSIYFPFILRRAQNVAGRLAQ